MKKLLLIVCIVIVVAFLVMLPFSSAIIHAVKNRFQAGMTSRTTISSTASSVSNSTAKNSSFGPLISHNIPAFASSNGDSASSSNDDSYDTVWESKGSSAWLAYDLSSVSMSKRSQVLVVWYNDETGNYDHTVNDDEAYNLPQDYTIDANAAAGGGNAPATGWVTLATVRNNHYHSRQQVVTMVGYNWLRITITATDGSIENYDTVLNMDIYDANMALTNDWIFFGDSITEGAMDHHTLNGTAAFAQLINTHVPDNYPVQESGGIGYLTSFNGMEHLNTWLSLFPGKYVGLSYGTNDALGCIAPATFYNHYVTMVQDVLHMGKIPLVPYIPWGRENTLQQCVPPLNAQITKLYSVFPQIIHGPDLWSFFQSHQNLISDDNTHPNVAGFAAYRQQWANAMLSEIYHVNP
jgi:lysophospholipase L1-like esterase